MLASPNFQSLDIQPKTANLVAHVAADEAYSQEADRLEPRLLAFLSTKPLALTSHTLKMVYYSKPFAP